MLSSIPLRIYVDLISKWLPLKEIGHLDTALCNDVERSTYMNVVSLDGFSMEDKIRFRCLNGEFYVWLILRNIKLNSLTFTKIMGEENANNIRVRVLRHFGDRLKHIDFGYVKSNEELLCPFLSGENVNIDHLTPRAQLLMCDVAEFCPNSVSLTMSSHLMDNTICLILTRCTQIQKLDLSRCAGISNVVLRCLCSLPNLANLDVSQCYFAENSFTCSYSLCASLRQLSAYDVKLGTSDLVTFMGLFPNVVDLLLTALDGECLAKVVIVCPCVETANICIKGALTDAQAQILADSWRHLQTLLLTSAEPVAPAPGIFPEEALQHFVLNHPHLWKLIICENEKSFPFEDDKIDIECTVAAPSLPLQVLFLESVTRATIYAIVTMCPNLRRFGILQPSVGFQPVGYAYPLEVLKDSSIRDLTLWHCALTPTSLEAIGSTRIAEMRYSNTTGLTDSSLGLLVKNTPTLHTITLEYCPKVSMMALWRVLENGPKLHTVGFSCDDENDNISGVFDLVMALVDKAYPNIQKITVN